MHGVKTQVYIRHAGTKRAFFAFPKLVRICPACVFCLFSLRFKVQPGRLLQDHLKRSLLTDFYLI